MGKAIRASVLLLLLCSVTRAGYIPNGSPTPPPQPASTATELQTASEDGTQGTSQNGVTQTALELLAGLLSIL
jgi:hypothetical protein